MNLERSISRPHFRLIDILKIFAAQCIVLHHLAAYGPLSDAAAQAWPDFMHGLFQHGRLAVQIFLVTAGYLAARSFSVHRLTLGAVTSSLWQRYVRLGFPFIIALIITVLCAAIARPYLEADVVPSPLSAANFLAHITLLHSVLDMESISAGAWYVAIDFQLYAAFALLLWASRGRRRLSVGLVAALTVASLVWFNTDSSWDVWALYFFGAYGLGALAWWAGVRAKYGVMAVVFYVTALGSGLASLMVNFRERLALAATVSVVLVSFGNSELRLSRHADKWISHFSKSAYALFLVHYGVLLLANAAWVVLGWEDGNVALLFITMSWFAALGASYLFHVCVEKRWNPMRGTLRPTVAHQAAK
jgi:peptidoglycan/LPS O-acetylase OafA/YrhL